MSILSGAWETFKTFLTLSDNLKGLNAESRARQQRIEALTERVVRLEMRAEPHRSRRGTTRPIRRCEQKKPRTMPGLGKDTR
jgi:hypothetical protein